MGKYIVKLWRMEENDGATMDYLSRPMHWELLPYKMKSEWIRSLLIFPDEQSCLKHIVEVKKEIADLGGQEACDRYLFEIVKLY